jgi:hypothetical protein
MTPIGMEIERCRLLPDVFILFGDVFLSANPEKKRATEFECRVLCRPIRVVVFQIQSVRCTLSPLRRIQKKRRMIHYTLLITSIHHGQ